MSATVDQIKAPEWVRRLPDPWRGRLKALHAAWFHGAAVFQMFLEVYRKHGSYVMCEVHLSIDVFELDLPDRIG